MIETADSDALKWRVAQYWDDCAEALTMSAWRPDETEQEDEAWARALRRALPLGKRLRVLDVGVGPGYLAGLVAKLGHEVSGVDIAPGMVELARERAEQLGLTLDLRIADADALPFPDDAFDAVIERDVLWTLPDPAGTLTEIRRVLRPYGYVLLIERARSDGPPATGQGDGDLWADLPFGGGFSAPGLTALVAGRGFHDVEISRLRGVHAARLAEHPERAAPPGTLPFLLRATKREPEGR